MNFNDENVRDKIKTVALIVIAISLAWIAFRFSDLIAVISVI